MSNEEQKMTVKGLLNLMSRTELSMPYKSGVIVGENEQPLLLSASQDLQTFALNLGGSSMKFPVRMVPYLIEALTKMYDENIKDKFEGNVSDMDDFKQDVLSKLNPRTYYKLQDVFEEMEDSGEAAMLENYNAIPSERLLGSSPSEGGQCGCGDPDCENNQEVDGDGYRKVGSTGKSGKFEDIANKAFGDEDNSEITEKIKSLSKTLDGIGDLTQDQKLDLLTKLLETRSELKEAQEKAKKALTREQQMELKEEVDKRMEAKLSEMESMLLGIKKEPKSSEDIDFEHIKKVFEKHGPLAAKEELMRLPEEKRDELVAKLVELMSK